MAIRMKVNENKNSICSECGCKWENTRTMTTILIAGNKINLCKSCMDDLLTKNIRMDVKYSAKLKDKFDMQRIKNEEKIRLRKIEKGE